jgi:hypothetical protein
VPERGVRRTRTAAPRPVVTKTEGKIPNIVIKVSKIGIEGGETELGFHWG